MEFKLHNHGAADAEDFDVDFYLSTNASITTRDYSLGSFSVDALAGNTTSDWLTKKLHLPKPGRSFWDGDGEYYVGMIVDGEKVIPEKNESNNRNLGIGIDKGTIKVTEHPEGTFTIIDSRGASIVLPQFDQDLGTLTRVEVEVEWVGRTDYGLYDNTPFGHQHTFSFPLGPLQLKGTAYPIPYSSTHPVLGSITERVFEGSELGPFLAGERTFWLNPSPQSTFDHGHAHQLDLGATSFTVTTKFVFDPPAADLVGVTLSADNVDGPVFAGDTVKVDYEIRNEGPEPSGPFDVSFYVSNNSWITTRDRLLETVRFENGLGAASSKRRTVSLTLPPATDEYWNKMYDHPHWVGMIVDRHNEVAETDEGNNRNRGDGMDCAPVEISRDRPGSLTLWSTHTNQIVLPAFDSSLGTLRRVEVEAALKQGVTTEIVTFSMLPHAHTFSFDVGPFHFDAGTDNASSASHSHQVSAFGPNPTQSYEGDQLAPFLSGSQTFRWATTPRSTDGDHGLASADFYVGTTFYFEENPDLCGGSFQLVSGSIEPGSPIRVEFAAHNDGGGDAGPFTVNFYFSDDLEVSQSDYLLGSYQIDSLAVNSATGSQSVSLTLPTKGQTTWSDRTHAVGMIIDPVGAVSERDEYNNHNLGHGIDSVQQSEGSWLWIPPLTDPVELGPVTWKKLTGLDFASGDLFYRLSAARQGTFTAFASADFGSNVELTLYDEDSNVLDLATSGQGTARVDHQAAAGEVLFLRVSSDSEDLELQLANLIHVADGDVTVFGSEVDDTLVISDWPEPEVLLNGIGYRLDALAGACFRFDGGAGNDAFALPPSVAASMKNVTVTFDGGIGDDLATVNGTSGNETIKLLPGEGTISGASLTVNVANGESVCVHGGGGIDVAYLHGNPRANDSYRADPGTATLSGNGYSSEVSGCRYVHAYGDVGNNDVAFLHDDPNQSDTFQAWPDMARLYGSNYYNRVKSFRWVHAYGTEGNQDVALLHDDPSQSDTFQAWPDMARLYGSDYYNRVKSFRWVHAWGTPGSNDVALLYDSANNDVFQAWPGMARLYGPGFYNRVKAFDWGHGKSTAGSVDVARLYGSQADDTLTATSRFTSLRGDGFFNRAVAFEQVEAYGSGGNDVAELHDAVLENGLAELVDSDALLWLSEFEQIRQRDSQTGGDSTLDAIDQFFTAYWP